MCCLNWQYVRAGASIHSARILEHIAPSLFNDQGLIDSEHDIDCFFKKIS
jgi:hypothetical protein